MKLAKKILFLAFTTLLPIAAYSQTPLPRDKVLASNPRATVTYADFEAEMARIPQRDQYEFMMDKDRIATLVDNILINKTLAIEARENKLENNVQAQAEISNHTDKVLAKYRGLQIQNSAPKIDYLPRAREIYLANPERFTSAPLYDVWHVLVNFTGRTKEQAKVRADELRARLVAGESPEKIAAENSDDGFAKTDKGNLGPSDLKTYDVRFAAAVRKLKPGEFSPVFESEFGFHVAKLRAYKAAVKLPFETVKAALINEAEDQYLNSVWEAHLRKIRNDPKLFVDVEALEQLRPKVAPVPSALPLPGASPKSK
ncbi:MAG: peptidylprolyl isomerase [Betaproteobacteria bacterium]